MSEVASPKIRITTAAGLTFDFEQPVTISTIDEPPPVEVLPTIAFTSDKTTLAAGQSVAFAWTVTAPEHVVEKVYFWDGMAFQGVGGIDSRVVTPAASTNYQLKVIANGGKEYFSPFITVTVTPAPQPGKWHADFFKGTALAGAPVWSTVYPDADLALSWGTGAPNPLVPVDNFSARFVRTAPHEAGSYTLHVVSDDGVRVWLDDQPTPILDKWLDQVGTFDVALTLSAGNHTFKAEYYEHAGAAQIAFSLRPTVNVISMRMVGVHCMQFSAEPFRSRLAGGQKSAFTVIDNTQVANQLFEQGHAVNFRRWWPDGAALSPQEVANMVPGELAPGISFVSSNENNCALGRREGEDEYQWLKRHAEWDEAVAFILASRGRTDVNICCMSMGTPNILAKGVQDGLRDFYKRLYDTQIARSGSESKPIRMWFDWHNYVPHQGWLYDQPDNWHPSVMALIPEMHAPGGYVVRTGQPGTRSQAEATWMEPAPAGAPNTIMAAAAERVVHSWAWFLTRHEFCFWPEYNIGFDPRVQRFRSTEGWVDEGGVGGGPAHGYNTADFQRGAVRMLELLSSPIEVNGVQYPNPYDGMTIFQMGEPTQWKGYDIIRYIESNDPVLQLSQWTRRA